MEYLIFIAAAATFAFFTAAVVSTLGREKDVLNPCFIFVGILSLQFLCYPVFARLADSFLVPDNRLPIARDLLDSASLLIAALAIGCILLGWLIPPVIRSAHPCNALTSNSGLPRLAAVNALVGIVLIIAVLLLKEFFDIFGGVEGFLVMIGAYRSGAYGGTGIYTYPATIFFPASVVYLYSVMAVYGRSSVPQRLWLLSLALLAGAFTLLLGFRIVFVGWLLTLVVVRHCAIAKIQLQSILIALPVGLVFLGGYGLARSIQEQMNSGILEPTIDTLEVFQSLLSPFVRSQSTDIVGLTLVQSYDREYFSLLFAEPVLGLIPKAFRPDFDIAGHRFGMDVMMPVFQEWGALPENLAGFSPNFVGFALWQGGLGGVVLCSILWGIALRLLYDLRFMILGSPLKVTLYAMLFSAAIMAVESPQDSLNALLVRLSFTVVIVVASVVLSALLPQTSFAGAVYGTVNCRHRGLTAT